MKVFNEKQVWFVTGSQTLYGPKVLENVAQDSAQIVASFNQSNAISVPMLDKGTVKSPDEILNVCRAANNDPDCVGLVLWMHTFSQAKMWMGVFFH